ncbi:hypothetical protein OESDEN_25631 [Oesophagostomum dentatum]|uniref:Uncharacterized protein n=1 Tax=Oesophagostomum dentatum TaxID=61180 RepID=A0A0B1RNZ3_OESDE|nr:hypothetical protein OESDEN_25631 [Oesophagostomum dentatum]
MLNLGPSIEFLPFCTFLLPLCKRTSSHRRPRRDAPVAGDVSTAPSPHRNHRDSAASGAAERLPTRPHLAPASTSPLLVDGRVGRPK